jgi:hypothetical protein
MSAASPWEYSDYLERRHSKPESEEQRSDPSCATESGKEAQLKQREQDMAIREKELLLRERETAMREQQTSIREQEAALNLRQHLFTLQLQSAVANQRNEASLGVGAQFHDQNLVSIGPIGHLQCPLRMSLIDEQS